MTKKVNKKVFFRARFSRHLAVSGPGSSPCQIPVALLRGFGTTRASLP
ncbi:MAG: hypothetical protein PHD61_11870 [Bacteroidales bacterium]|nr:hypothetical protein [Lentimicrobiaceae bacterium]MDD5695986.1 hypothetical protein [Bacteroidales bacterium]